MINTKKTTQDVLQEEILRERAAVLARAGERLEEALAKLSRLEGRIAEALAAPECEAGGGRSIEAAEGGRGLRGSQGHRRINGMIRAYNRQREAVLTCHYELIVTREALGIRHHQRIAEIYRIPPKKCCLPE
ncbi:MAG: hypothetical protein LLG93_04240 [Deltaproteobacteria bacterium]|nr:hypothetical protein [Deltaproteobacteria bacterium]